MNSFFEKFQNLSIIKMLNHLYVCDGKSGSNMEDPRYANMEGFIDKPKKSFFKQAVSLLVIKNK